MLSSSNRSISLLMVLCGILLAVAGLSVYTACGARACRDSNLYVCGGFSCVDNICLSSCKDDGGCQSNRGFVCRKGKCVCPEDKPSAKCHGECFRMGDCDKILDKNEKKKFPAADGYTCRKPMNAKETDPGQCQCSPDNSSAECHKVCTKNEDCWNKEFYGEKPYSKEKGFICKREDGKTPSAKTPGRCTCQKGKPCDTSGGGEGGGDEFGMPDGGGDDFGMPDYGSDDFGMPDYGSDDFGTPDYGSDDFGMPDGGGDDFGVSDAGSEDFSGPQD